MSQYETVRCPNCNGKYKMLAAHWSRSSDCEEPSLTDRQNEIATGIFMGDGSMVGPESSRQFKVYMNNKKFLEWFDNEMAVFTTGVKKGQTPEYQARMKEKHDSGRGFSFDAEDYQQQWFVSGRTVSDLQKFDDWYSGSGGKKVYPDDLELTPLIAKMWYVTDGWLDTTDNDFGYVSISCYNEIGHNDGGKNIRSLFEDQGFTVHTNETDVFMYKNESEKFFNWVGSPPAGFEYKWPDKFC
jgi:hypothetical protein